MAHFVGKAPAEQEIWNRINIIGRRADVELTCGNFFGNPRLRRPPQKQLEKNSAYCIDIALRCDKAM